MRIVVDSSVLVAAHISRAGVCAELMEDVLMHHELVTSRFILDELARKLDEKFDFPARTVTAVVAFLEGAAQLVEPAAVPEEACRDPLDVPVLGTALSGKADLLITVDKDLLTLTEFCGIPIIKPGEFWHRLRE